jgi:hypothetical protein
MKKYALTLNKWVDKDKKPISCAEKLKVLNENLSEILELVHEAHEDAILMGVEEQNFWEILEQNIKNL